VRSIPAAEAEAPRAGASVPRVVARAVRWYWVGQLYDRAAALTYYAMMSLFPAVLAGVSLLGLVGGEGLVTDASDYVLDHGADKATADALEATLEHIVNASSGALGVAFVISVGLAINGASSAFGAAGRALNVIYAVEEDRGFVRRKLEDVGMTLVVLALFVVVLVAVFLGGGIVEDIANRIGLGHTAATVWRIVRWPLAVAAAVLAYALVYAFAPAIRPARWRWISPGAAFGVVLWLLASAGFALYLQHFSNYGAAYGTAGAVIVLLLWIYLSANAFLLGAVLDAELERRAEARREPAAAAPAPG
jgi:membrane protein